MHTFISFVSLFRKGWDRGYWAHGIFKGMVESRNESQSFVLRYRVDAIFMIEIDDDEYKRAPRYTNEL